MGREILLQRLRGVLDLPISRLPCPNAIRVCGGYRPLSKLGMCWGIECFACFACKRCRDRHTISRRWVRLWLWMQLGWLVTPSERLLWWFVRLIGMTATWWRKVWKEINWVEVFLHCFPRMNMVDLRSWLESLELLRCVQSHAFFALWLIQVAFIKCLIELAVCAGSM